MKRRSFCKTIDNMLSFKGRIKFMSTDAAEIDGGQMLSLFKFRRAVKGQSLVEYALLIVLISIVCIGLLKRMGLQTSSTYDDITEQMVAASDPGGCWVAAELYGGWFEPKTIAARYYVNNIAPTWFKDLYLAHGQDFAKMLREHPELKPLIRPLFERFSEEGAKALAEV